MLADGGHSLPHHCNPNDAIANILLKYRRGELHLGATGVQTFEWADF